MVSTTSLLGAAGEHYVMSELLRRGYIAALAPAGVPNMDIIVADTEGNRLCSIQVKTRSGRGGDGGWHMSVKHERLCSDALFYCFVDFGGTERERPEIYVIPSAMVAEVVSRSHAVWLRNPGRDGRTRRDSNVRRLLPNYDRVFRPEPNPYPEGWLAPYRNAWHLLPVHEQAETSE